MPKQSNVKRNQALYTSLFELIYLHERKNIKEQAYLLGNDCLHREFESLSNRHILKGNN